MAPQRAHPSPTNLNRRKGAGKRKRTMPRASRFDRSMREGDSGYPVRAQRLLAEGLVGYSRLRDRTRAV